MPFKLVAADSLSYKSTNHQCLRIRPLRSQGYSDLVSASSRSDATISIPTAASMITTDCLDSSNWSFTWEDPHQSTILSLETIASSFYRFIIASADIFSTISIPLISCGQHFIAFSDQHNRLWTYGLDCSLEPTASDKKLALIGPFDVKISQIAVGDSHCLIATDHDRLYSLGTGLHGELGCGHIKAYSNSAIEIAFPIYGSSPAEREYPISIAASACYSLVVTGPHGYVYSFGSGAYGRHGEPSDGLQGLDVLQPRRIIALDGVGEWRPNGTCAGIKSCACGSWHSIVIATGTNDVYGWGWNKFSQLGIHSEDLVASPTRLSELDSLLDPNEEGNNIEIVSVTCGVRHTALLTSTGKVITLGMIGIGNHLDLSLRGRELIAPSVTCESEAVAITSYRWGLVMATAADGNASSREHSLHR